MIAIHLRVHRAVRLRSVLAAAIGLVLTASLAACGSSSAKGGSDTYTIGVAIPLSGPIASSSALYRSAMEYWATQHPQIDGRKVKVVYRDDLGTADGGIAAARALLDQDKVDALVGSMLSGPTTGILPLTTSRKTFQVVMSSLVDAGDPKKAPYAFQIEGQKKLEAPAMLTKIREEGGSKVGFLVVDNPLGQSTIDSVTGAVKDAGTGVELVSTQRFSTGSTDLTVQIKKIKDAGADSIIFNAAVPTDYVVGLKAVTEVGFGGKVYGNSALALNDVQQGQSAALTARCFATGFQSGVLRGTITKNGQAVHDGIKKFLNVSELKGSFYMSATGYDAIDIVRQAIEGSKSFDSAKMARFVEGNPIPGVKTTYRFSAESHLGLTSADMAWAVPGSMKDGLFVAARG
jgi:ABC-type branched-subunit amino acid transport system substrate-binding protein